MRVLAIVFSFLLISGFAFAAESDVDGTWVGSTPRGSSIKVVVAGGQAKQYYFQGRSQGVVGGKFKGGATSFGLRTEKSAKVVLKKMKGDKPSYTYTDKTGPDALKVTLTKN